MLRKLLLPFLFVAFFANMAFAQTGSITGKVTNEKGEPVPTANVLLMETNQGAATNLEGEYTISNVDPGTYTLRVTFVGYKDYKTKVTVEAGQTLTKNVTLEQEAVGLDELVVTAFGITREKRATTSQTQNINVEDLNTVQPTSAAEGLAGKVAGLQINHQSSGVKPANQILLRGMRSISFNNEPVVVIDGTRASVAAFRDLNPNDIENVNVLKGATSAALY